MFTLLLTIINIMSTQLINQVIQKSKGLVNKLYTSQGFYRHPFPPAVNYQVEEHVLSSTIKTIPFFDSNLSIHRQIPYEIKESAVKNVLGISLSAIIGNTIPMFAPFTSWLTIAFGVNLFYRTISTMWNSVIKADVINDGKQIAVTLKRNSDSLLPLKPKVIDIAKISKGVGETTLMDTFVEPFMFPISVQDKNLSRSFYFYGIGHGSILNGPVFRSVINGKILPSKQ